MFWMCIRIYLIHIHNIWFYGEISIFFTFYHFDSDPRFPPFLAHLSRRLTVELIGCSWSGVRPSSSVVVRPSVVNNFKHLLLQNYLPDQSQILCGASFGRGNESLFTASWSRSFLDLGPRSCTTKIQTGFSQKLLSRSEPFFMKAFRYKEMKI